MNNTFKSNYLLWIIRIFTGAVFVFSGLIKANDPLGFSYKLEEYFQVFNMVFLNDFAVIIAVLLCSLEIILGTLLILGFWKTKVMWGLLLLIVFFTFLTFYSAFFKVVTSCGCFGDAIPLTPWQSFGKDIVLLILIIFLFINRKKIESLIKENYTISIVTAGIIVISIGIGTYTYNFLPFVDFLPYKIGNNIPALMRIPEGAKLDEYTTTYRLRNKENGKEQNITDKDYLETEIWKDENWEIIGDPKTVLVKEGYRPLISDLVINDANGIDNTNNIIHNPDYNFIIVAYDMPDTNIKALNKLNKLAEIAAEQYNIRTILLTSSSAQVVESVSNEINLVMEIFYADAVPLKSMVRANPGILLMKNGNIINKWHFHLIPSFKTLTKNYFSKD